MIETTGFALAALAYSVAVSSGSMATAAYFNQIHHLPLGHTLVLIVWCGFGTGFLAYAKQKLGKPAFNTACSLACMVIFVNLIRDGICTEASCLICRERPIGSIQRRLYPQDIENRIDGSLDFEFGLLSVLASVSNYKIKVSLMRHSHLT